MILRFDWSPGSAREWMKMTKMFGNRRQGTTLIEVLVVIVVFAVGILAVMQVFPGGLRIMADQRDRSVAQQLGKSALQREDGRTETFPEQILPLSLTSAGATVNLAPNPNQKPDPTGVGVSGISIDVNGIVSNASGPVGDWEHISGANIYRRIVNEGHRMASPRQTNPNNTTSPQKTFGCLVLLNYGPCLTNATDHESGLVYNPLFHVVGADMIQRAGIPDPVLTTQDYVYYVDQEDSGSAVLYLPRTTAPSGSHRYYDVRLSATVRLLSTQVVHADYSFQADMDSNTAGGYGAYNLGAGMLAAGALHAGDAILSVDKDTIQVARQFVNVGTADFSLDPFEYRLLNWSLGQVLFNPAAATTVEDRPQGRTPLKARVSYDVYDWRILHEDFRVPGGSSQAGATSLPVRNLKVLSHSQPDGRTFSGMDVPITDWDNANATVISNYSRDFAIIDTETGAAYVPSGYSVDYSRGVVIFNSSNAPVIYPGDTMITTIPAAGRSVRAYFMAEGDYAVQVQKASANYKQVYDTPGIGEFFVGGTKPGAPGFGNPHRIYFAAADLGQSVRFDRIAYLDGANKMTVNDQSLQISQSQADAVGPYIDLLEIDPNVTSIDLSDGLGVTGVHGASVSVRTLWNRSAFTLGTNGTANANAVDSYRQTYKTLRLTTTFMGGEAQ